MVVKLKMRLRTYFVTGALTILPVIVTLYIINIGINLLDAFFGSLFTSFIEQYKFPGIKLLIFAIEFVLALFIIILTGFFMTNFIGRRILSWGEGAIGRLPVVRRIYNAVKQLIETLFKRRDSFNQVVLVEYPRKGIYSIGFVTCKTTGDAQKVSPDELINVFIATTPNPTSGMLIIAPKNQTIPLKMSVEEGIKLIISGGIIAPDNDE